MATKEQLQEIIKCEKELKALATKLRNIYINTDVEGGFYLYNKRIKYKIDRIVWDIYHKQIELKHLRDKYKVSKI